MTTTTTARPAWSATDKQRNWITDLTAQRDVPASVVTINATLCADDAFTKTMASQIIDELLAKPFKKKAAAAVSAATPDAATLGLVPNAFFAIPTSELPADLAALAGHSDLLFGQVREWQGRAFIDTLKGAPGAWARDRRRGAQKAALVKILKADQLSYMKRFNAEYTVCGKCASPLSDDTSRATGFGPDCRKMLGI